MKQSIPKEILGQHIGSLGKTGSGKTSTTKLVVEQVAAEGYHVCILDAIKSDWWGITSSADGKHPGLPFKILGGPHGHVPLNSSAGAIIGNLVGSGKLPLSIIDMADFEAGGLQRFFVDFAPALMRSMKGVLYLVIEEAHEFAPKERAGFGAESMAIHWAKKLATAGRSKGIRLIVATQRVQSLHNAVLGSCETVIAHRMSAPADQEPVLKWLKANADKETTDAVAKSLSSLPTGTGWLCSGEARIFQQVAFPKFKTYDNTATPEKDGAEKQVKTAAVDPDELRQLIGDALKENEDNDPKLLKKKIAELEKAAKAVKNGAPIDSKELEQRAKMEYQNGYMKGKADGYGDALKSVAPFAARLNKLAEEMLGVSDTAKSIAGGIADWSQRAASVPVPEPLRRPHPRAHDTPEMEKRIADTQAIRTAIAKPKGLTQRILAILANYPQGRSKTQVALMAGVAKNGGHFNNTMGKLRTDGLIEGIDHCKITAAGHAAIGPVDPLPTGTELVQHWRRDLGGVFDRILDILSRSYPEEISKHDLAAKANIDAAGGHFNNSMGKLRTLGLVTGIASVRLSDDLFSEAA